MSCVGQLFEEQDELDRLEGFVWLHGPAFYGLPANDATIRLVRRDTPLDVPGEISTAAGTVTVFDPMFPLHWDVEA